MIYTDDIKELKDFINAQFNSSLEQTDYNVCLSRVVTEIEDDFLMNRASLLKVSIAQDIDLKVALGKLSTICNNVVIQCDDCPIKKYCNQYILEKQQLPNDNSFKMIDLFCGAGGLSLGFTQEGFVTSLANDIESCCVDTYSHNHPDTPRKHIILGDIKDVVVNVKELSRYDSIDILVGGPPCQGFSMANRQRLIADPRNRLYKSYIEILKITNPRFFVMENVKGMLSAANQVIEDFESAGYSVSKRVLNAKDCGVPQNRERLIFIGNNIGVDNELIFDKILLLCKDIQHTVLADALFGLKPLQASRIRNATTLENDESGRVIDYYATCSNDYIKMINQGRSTNIVLNHKARYNNDRDIKIYSRLNPGDKSDDPKIADIMPYKSRNDIFKDKYYKLEPNKISKTITAHMKFDCNMYIHPFQARGLTPREAARIQSFPDDYFFRGAYTKTYMQIGNSVPPLLGRVIAQAIKSYM